MLKKILRVACLVFVALGIVMLVVGNRTATTNPEQSGSYIGSGFFLIVAFGACFGLLFVKKLF